MTEQVKKSAAKRAAEKIKKDNENGARQAVIEDLFFDFHRSRVQIYWMNFWRGIFFGIGSVVGVTLFVVISVAAKQNRRRFSSLGRFYKSVDRHHAAPPLT